jgi:two-component system LytT family sensor kinase
MFKTKNTDIMKKSIQLMFHLLFWIFTSLFIILGFQLLSLPAMVLGTGGPDIQEQFYVLLIALPIGGCIFYTSYFSLNFFIKRPIRFIWVSIFYAILISVLILVEVLEDGDIDFLDILILLLPILYFNIFGFLFKTFFEWINDRKIKAELEKENITSQLELLKAQINPHFLFNTLNNIDILIQDESEKASMYLKKLSEILRFMLYESNTDRIPLSEEIAFIKKYIELQKIRTSNDNFIELEISGNATNQSIAPMVFIHFIENAFKFATNKKIEKAISIFVDISDMLVKFTCKNHINESNESETKNCGLGFPFIKKRLDLIYNKAYSIDIVQEDSWYIVNLEIRLDND